MTALRVALFNLAFYGLSFGSAFALWVLAKLGKRERMFRMANAWGHATLWLLRVILGSTVEVRGLDRLPEGGPRLIVAKHQSELDVVMLAVLFPNSSAVAMAELAKYPFFGPLLRGLDVVLVAVDEGPQGRTEQVIRGARRIIEEQGRPMTIYPEGELMRLGARERYRRGAGRIYEALDIAAVPVVCSHGAIWPRREWHKHPGRKAVLEVLEPIPPGLGMDAFMQTIEERIETATMQLIREAVSGDELAEAERRYAGRLNNHGVEAAAEAPGESGDRAGPVLPRG